MIKINCETSETLKIEHLTEFQGNLKARDERDVQKIIKSIKKHGFSFPFFVWKHDGINHVFDGHGRLLALNALKDHGEEIPPLPVVYVNPKDEAEAKELLLKLNSQYGHMTADSVAEFLGEIKIDPAELALPDGVLDLNMQQDEPEDLDDAPALDEFIIHSKPGELYKLGPHRLFCGDSTNPDDVAKLMDGIKADLVVTDPPYNVAYDGNKNPKTQNEKNHGANREIKNDLKNDKEFYNFLLSAFKNIIDYLKAGGVFYIWHADSEGINFRTAMRDAGGEIKQCLIWVKNCIILGRQDYQWRHEPCLYGWKAGASHYWDGRRDLSTTIDERPEYGRMDKKELIEVIKELRGDNKPNSIIYEDRPNRSDEHPTMKPVKLFKRLIINSSKEEDVILDLFGGSGTSLIAAAELNRTARLMELDPKYCDVIRRRWTKYAKEKGLEPGPGALEDEV